MSITGSGTISSSLDSPGLIWTSYNGYFRLITNKIQAGASGDAVVHYSDWRLTGYVSAI